MENVKTTTQPKKVTRVEATNRYHLVLNVDSLTGCIHGWRFAGKLVNSLADISTLTILARTVAVIGAYKVGKTFLTRHLLGSDLVDDEIIQTYGVSMALPNNFASDKQETPNVEDEEDDDDNFSMRPTEKVSTTNRAVTEMAILDTAGTDRNTPEKDMDDALATEWFLREFIIEVTQRVVVVVPRFDRKALKNIKRLIHFINNKHPDRKIERERRLLIVHNYVSVRDPKTLEDKINEVAFVYKDQRNPHAWVELNQNSVSYYQTTNTTHVFLVDNNSEWGKVRNANVFEFIKGVIRNDSPHEFNLVNEFLSRASKNLVRYLDDWWFQLKVQKNEKGFYYVAPTLPDGNNNNDSNEMTEDERSIAQQILEKKEPLELQDLSYSDKGVVSESIKDLEGIVFTDNEKNLLFIRLFAPGFNESHKNPGWIKFFFSQECKDIDIRIRLPEPDVQFLYSTIKFGKGIFEYTLPTGVRFERPRTPKDVWDKMSIVDGVIQFELSLQRKWE